MKRVFICCCLTMVFALPKAAYAVGVEVETFNCVKELAKGENVGRLGVACLGIESGLEYSYNGEKRFPLQSVFKAPLAVAVLQKVDSGKLSLSQNVGITAKDLSVPASDITEHFSGPTQSFSLADLITRMVQSSDNTASDVLLGLIGGPQEVTDVLLRGGIHQMRIDRSERQLQPGVFGLPAVKTGQVIDQSKWQRDKEQAKSARNRQAFEHYVYRDPRDTSTPKAMVAFLAELYKGKLLSPPSTKYLLDVMAGTRTGLHRLNEGLPPGAKLAHKTGTGPDLDGVNSATNDVGIITLSSDYHIAIAVFLAGSRLPEKERDGIISSVCRCVTKDTKPFEVRHGRID